MNHPVLASHSFSQCAPFMDKRVEIHGTSRADMNGKRGVATDFHPMDYDDRATWRYTVRLDSGEMFKLKLDNVRLEGLRAPLLDQRVKTCSYGPGFGNGRLGVAVDFEPSEKVYKVKFDEGEIRTVPAANLRAEGAGKAKGKGNGKGKRGGAGARG